MDTHPEPAKTSLGRLGPWFIVLLVLLFVAFIRFRILDMPLERDEGEYAYVGQLILQGIPPYQLAYNMKFPGTYLAYAAGMTVFGQTTAGIHATLLVVNSLTIVFMFLLGRKLLGTTAGLVACAAYAIMSVSPTVFGMSTHANHFVVLFAVPALLLLLAALESRRRRLLFASGLLFGLAVLMKQQGAVFGFFAGAVLVWTAVRDRSARAVLLKNISSFAAGAVLPFALLCLALARAGVFHQFWFWTFVYAHSYVQIASWENGWKLLLLHWHLGIPSSIGFWALAVIGLAAGFADAGLRKKTFFIAMFWLFSFWGAATGLYFREQYFILVLPAFALLAGLAVVSLQKRFAGQTSPSVIPLTLFIAVFGATVFFQRHYFFSMNGVQLSRTIYRGFPFVEAIAMADYIRTHSATDDRVAVLGSEPEIYFYSRRHSATGYIYTYPLMEPQPFAAQMQREMIHEIETNQPSYLVWVSFNNSWMVYPSTPDTTIFHWFNDYAERAYERVGVAQLRPDGTSALLWEDDAKNYKSAGEQYVAVYKRRPPVETVSPGQRPAP